MDQYTFIRSNAAISMACGLVSNIRRGDCENIFKTLRLIEAHLQDAGGDPRDDEVWKSELKVTREELCALYNEMQKAKRHSPLLTGDDCAKAIQIMDAELSDIEDIGTIYYYAQSRHNHIPSMREEEQRRLAEEFMRQSYLYTSELLGWDRYAAFRVARHQGEVVGFADTRSIAGETNSSTAMINLFYVDPGYWREKVGTRLIKHAEQFLRGNGAKLGVLKTSKNENAVWSFYSAMGWRQYTGPKEQNPLYRTGIEDPVFVKNFG
jgi:GNAT superfamily N-acetyltransferase